jgi:hypothetical protein
MQQDNETTSSGGNMREAFGLLYLTVSVHSACVTPFLRVGFGWEGLGLPAILAIPFVFTVAAIKQAPEMTWFLPVWFVAVVVQRIITAVNHSRGIRVHSRFQGIPWFAMRVLRVRKDRMARLLIEPLLCVLAGLCLTLWSEVTGGFIAAAALSLIVKATIDLQTVDRRLQQMRDAHIEQTYFAERFRDGN